LGVQAYVRCDHPTSNAYDALQSARESMLDQRSLGMCAATGDDLDGDGPDGPGGPGGRLRRRLAGGGGGTTLEVFFVAPGIEMAPCKEENSNCDNSYGNVFSRDALSHIMSFERELDAHAKEAQAAGIVQVYRKVSVTGFFFTGSGQLRDGAIDQGLQLVTTSPIFENMADPYFDLDTHPETNVTSAMYAFFGDATQIEQWLTGTMCVRNRARARVFSPPFPRPAR
jgi:hypothetical protein